MASVRFNTRELIARVRLGAARGVLAATEELRNAVVTEILDTPKSGRIYRRRGVVHQASAPGESPASDTGRLVNSIRTEYGEDGLTGRVVAGTVYAAYLEYGTTRMEARPFMRPALAKSRPMIVQTINRAVRSAVAGGTP